MVLQIIYYSPYIIEYKTVIVKTTILTFFVVEYVVTYIMNSYNIYHALFYEPVNPSFPYFILLHNGYCDITGFLSMDIDSYEMTLTI